MWIYNNQPNQSSHTFQSSISCDKPITGQIHVRCVEQRRRREDKIITRQHDLKNNSFWTFLLFLLLRSTHTKSIRTLFCSIGVKNVKFKTFGFLLENCVSELNTGAPNDNFRKIICSEDDLRSRIFGSFFVKFVACLPLLGFSNI